jgi:SAM-dependent methyltransferase
MLACPICESQKVDHAFDKGAYSYHRCSFCQVLFVQISLSHSAVHEHYGEIYFESDGKERGGRHGYPSYRASQSTLTGGFGEKLNFIRRYVTKGNLLDAGAAYGFFLKVAEPFFDGIGLDISPYAADAAKQEFNARVSVGDIEQTDFPNNRFDVVVMWDIIEHIISPVKALKEVNRLLKPGGYLFVSTDDAGNWLPRLLSHRWWALGAPMHLCHFSKRGLEVACGLAGFEPPAFFRDPRHYTISEIIKHFGVSYQSSLLSGIGKAMDRTFLKKLAIHIARPEQFIAVIHKQV